MDIQSFPWLFAAIVGFGHAFEADHLLAVGNIVTRRDNLMHAVKDGIYWGLGHTSTIFLFGLLMIVGKMTFFEGYFGYFEAIVGVMLIVLGFVRMNQFFNRKRDHHADTDKYHVAYGVGLIHGLAGSGAMILLVMTEVQGNINSLLYLLVFGVGSVVGMLLAAGIFSLPFSRKITDNQTLQLGLVLLSSLLCIGYGGYIVYQNLV
ncbi:MAG: urease accessory protein [Saprospiraceae bacterium]|nr:urease accessory protein [Saprospiraceae bacterium]